jgi:AraC-like DNA-binding protein
MMEKVYTYNGIFGKSDPDGRVRHPSLFRAAERIYLHGCVNEPVFEDIVRLPVIKDYGDAFRMATGVPLTVVSPGEPDRRHAFGQCENGFCGLAAGTAAGCEACLQVQVRAKRGAARLGTTQQVTCFAGLTDVAVPVVIRGRHVATLMSGQVFRREPTQRDFGMIARMLGTGQDAAWESRLRKTYFATPVVTAERFGAIVQLLNVFAQYLADFADHHLAEKSGTEPEAVSNAKAFVQTRIVEAITLDEVVAHVGVSRFYFCKLFKRATGMTLTEYITHVRMEKVKVLLVDPSLRISEIVYAAGFGSIPRFNSAFKRHFGMPPTAYRALLREQLSG